MGIFNNTLLSSRGHDHLRLDRSTPSRWHSRIRKALPRSAAAAAAACIGAAFTSRLLSRKPNHDPALHACDEAEEEEPEALPPNHPHTIRLRRLAADLIAAACDEQTFIRHPKLWRRIRRRLSSGIDWKVDVNADWNIDAYSRYDGEIRVSLGTLYLFWKDGDTAATLGHEIAHVIAGHVVETLKKRFWVSLLVNFTGELLDVPGDKIASEAWESLYMRPYYFRKELEADRIGLLLLGAAGYNPHIAPNQWFKLDKFVRSLELEPKDYDDLTLTHPPHMIRGQKLLHTKVMNEALELYRQALRSGKVAGPDSVASALMLQLACCKFYIDNWLQRVWKSLLPTSLWNRVRNSAGDRIAMVHHPALPIKRWSRQLMHNDAWTMPVASRAAAYRMIFQQGDIASPCAKLDWECWAPLYVKCLVWQLLHGRLWTEDDRPDRHKDCLLCNQDRESAVHIMFNCSFAKQVWRNILSRLGIPAILPPAVPSVDVWWKHLRSLLPEDERKALDTLFVLIVWHLWLERNARVLGREEKMTSAQLTAKIEQEAIAWIGAGADGQESVV